MYYLVCAAAAAAAKALLANVMKCNLFVKSSWEYCEMTGLLTDSAKFVSVVALLCTPGVYKGVCDYIDGRAQYWSSSK